MAELPIVQRVDRPTSTTPSLFILPPVTYSSVSLQKLRKYTGFTKTSSFIFFMFTAGVLSVYCIARLADLDYEGSWSQYAAPSELYWFREGVPKFGMKIHMWSVIPAGVLMPLQFLPVIRHRYTAFHRLNGRLLLVLLIIGNLTALMVMRHAFGGTLTTQTGVATLAIQITLSIFRGYGAIRDLQIGQHRAWMIRAWAYAGAIITVRILLVVVAILATFSPFVVKTMTSCQELFFVYNTYELPLEDLQSTYPACNNNISSSSPIYVSVNGDISGGRPEETHAMMVFSFGVSVWLSLIIHTFAAEIYLKIMTDEDERLKIVSLKRRKDAGIVNDSQSPVYASRK